MTDETHTFRSRNLDGTWNEIGGLTAEQAAKLDNGQAAAWTVSDEKIVVDDDDKIAYVETAR
jgi:hypothetical protein